MTAELVTAGAFRPSLFSAFVQWVDRGEQTTKTYLNHLKQFFAWTRYREIIEPIREDIIAFREWLLREHEAIQLDERAAGGWTYRRDVSGRVLIVTCTPNTTAQYLRSVKQFFRWTWTSGLYPDISANIRPPKVARNIHKRDALTAAEVLTVETWIKENAQTSLLSAEEKRKSVHSLTNT